MIPPILYLFGLFGGATNAPVVFVYVGTPEDATPVATEAPLDVIVSAPGTLP